jgi:signal transduction histidine kinase
VGDRADRGLDVLVHELRTPVAVATQVVDTLVHRDGALGPDMSAELLRVAQRHLREAADLLDHLATTDEAGGQFQTVVQPVDVTVLVAEAASDLSCLADGRLARPRLPTQECIVHADAEAVRRILAALVNNAVAHSPPEVPIEVRVDQEPDGAVIAVLDRGPGIPDEQRDDIFRLGYRRGPAGGTHRGLGLFLARGLARSQGGELSADDRPDGPGARFSLWLPRAGQDQDPATASENL